MLVRAKKAKIRSEMASSIDNIRQKTFKEGWSFCLVFAFPLVLQPSDSQNSVNRKKDVRNEVNDKSHQYYVEKMFS